MQDAFSCGGASTGKAASSCIHVATASVSRHTAHVAACPLTAAASAFDRAAVTVSASCGQVDGRPHIVVLLQAKQPRQLAFGAVEQHFHASFAKTQGRRDVTVLHALDIRQPEQLTLLHRQPLERANHVDAEWNVWTLDPVLR